MKKIFTLFFLFVIGLSISAQITTSPAFPSAASPVTITVNLTGTPLEGYSSNLYAHTGVDVTVDGVTKTWQHVIGSWGNNTTQPKLTYIGANTYQLVISPDINAYYSVASNETVTRLCFVFRASSGSPQTTDLFVNVYRSMAVEITSPASTYIGQNDTKTITASASTSADLTLKLNETLLESASGTAISTAHTFTQTGNHWLIASATANGQTVYDSLRVFVSQTTSTQTKPSGWKKGINYLSNTEAGLVLQAPGKTDVYVLGDFNNWEPSAAYQMKKDGELFWLKLENLVSGQPYVFQYWIDGEIQVADPYSDLIVDPYDDSTIPASVYPNIPAYPTGKASDRASVLQTAQTAYQWKSASFSLPSKEKLNIYELLIRDFTDEGTCKAAIGKLGYLQRLGVNAIELMPVNEFEGNSSWGYNPNFYFAPDKAYGTKDDLKELIDSIHGRGMIVIQDLVLNHAYNSCPLVKMYWNAANNRPAADNPWFNQTSPNTAYSWGSDFNHESAYTKAFVDTVTTYWMNEYKVDGFRFDFTKGFTNTAGDGSAYDASRITILNRMATHIWSVKPEAFVILEHFADNSEEKVLAASGLMLWGNANYAFNEATMAWTSTSDFNWASYQSRGFTSPGLVAYMESHDEERLMYKNLNYGNASGSYDIKTLATALDRNKLAAAFFFSLPGPKMIWQFGELGYDYSIDYNDRVGEKPVRWDYLDDAGRLKLFDVYSAMLRLREKYAVFTAGTETRSLAGATKYLQLAKDGHDITVVGNFGVTAANISAPFAQTGTWYEFFTGTEYAVTAATQSMVLQAGEYRLYSNVKLPAFGDLATDVTDPVKKPASFSLYPNPASTTIRIETTEPMQALQIITLEGRLVRQLQPAATVAQVGIENLNEGLYLIRVRTAKGTFNQKFIKSN